MDATQAALDRWCSTERIDFLNSQAEENYRQRTRRIADAVLMKIPDRVPLVPFWGMFLLHSFVQAHRSR